MKDMKLENITEFLNVPGIYQIKIKEKDYIGSSVSIGHRLKHHLWALKSKKHHNRTMQNCWNKYQHANFEMLERCESNILIEREKHYIDTLSPYMNHILNPQKIIRSEIYRQKLSQGLKKAYANGLEPHNKQEVHMYSLIGRYIKTFSSITAAGDYFKSGPTGICAVLNGRTSSAQKHLWSTEKLDKIQIPNKNYVIKSVSQCTLENTFIKKWNSIKVAQTKLNINNIHRAAFFNRTAGGFRWKFE
jgi:hypothetical protein